MKRSIRIVSILFLLGYSLSVNADDLGRLINRLKDEEAANRIETADRLKRMGTDAARALPALERLALNDPAKGVRIKSAEAIAAIAPEKALEILIRERDKRKLDRKKYEEILFKMMDGMAEVKFIPLLSEAFEDRSQNDSVRDHLEKTLVGALGKIKKEHEDTVLRDVGAIAEASKSQEIRQTAKANMERIGFDEESRLW